MLLQLIQMVIYCLLRLQLSRRNHKIIDPGFFITLRHHVTQREGICLISDWHARINVAIRNPSVGWSPLHAQHRYCLRHVVSNFNDKFKNKVLKELAYKARSQHQPWKHERCMEELK